MTELRPTISDDPRRSSDAERGGVADLHDVIGRMLARPVANADGPPEADLSNVIPFARGRREGPAQPAPAVTVSAADRFFGAIKQNRIRIVVLLACSAAAHAALYLPFMREPEPMASIGEHVISAEIVVGASEDAGLVKQGGDQAASAPDPATTPEPEVEQPKPLEPEPEPPRVETALAPPATETPVEAQQAPPQEPPTPVEANAAPAEPQVATVQEFTERPSMTLQAPMEAVPDRPIAPTEIQAAPMEPAATPAELQATLNPEGSTETQAAPLQETKNIPEPPKPELTKPTELKKPVPPRPEPVRQPPKEAAKPEVAKPTPQAKPKTENETRRATLTGAPNESRSTAPAAAAAGGVGRGRSDASSNYPGLVAAHLRRFQQYPSDARSRGDQGSVQVTFSLSSGGGVTSVRLARGIGIASLDAEATAMVRRASPFPAPPDGRPQNFTVPIGFRLN